MKWFKIYSIYYGWFDCMIAQNYIVASDYLDYDMPKFLLDKVYKVVKGKSAEEYLYLMNEPGANMLKISLNKDSDKVNFSEYKLLKDSTDLDENELYEINNFGECLFSTDVLICSTVDDLLTEFSLFENGNGRVLYEKHWNKFPTAEFESLKAFAYELQLTEKYNFLCTTFLNPGDWTVK